MDSTRQAKHGMLHQMSATVVTWNVEWATPRSWSRRDEILRRIERHQPDVICLTEADVMLLSDKAGHTIHHIALSEDLAARSLGLIDRSHGDRELSDHPGIVAELTAQG